MTTGIFGSGFTSPPPNGTFPPPPPLVVVYVEVYKEIDLVDFSIFSLVTLVGWIQLLVLIRITSDK